MKTNDINTVTESDIFEGGSIDLSDAKTRRKYERLANLKMIHEFVTDEAAIIRKELFPFSTFKYENKEIAAFGVFLVKEKETFDKNNTKTGIKQFKVPLLICSDHKPRYVNSILSEIYRIKFDLPNAENYPERWSTDSIKDWVGYDAPEIDGYKLFLKIKEQYKKYLYFTSDSWYNVHALWDMGTYFFLLFKYYPILELRGLPGTAKSKIMTVSRCITFNASEELTNPSESTLFRDTHENRPTLYIDEAEKLFIEYKGRIEPDSRAEVINSGYKFTGKVPRQEKFGNKFKTIYFSTYCPKMVASIRGLHGATEDRSISHIMTRPPQGDKRGELEPDDLSKEWQFIRDDNYVFALQNCLKIKKFYDEFDEDIEIKSRDFWIWKPLLVLAKYLDTELYEDVKKFATELSEVKKIDTIPEGSTEYNILIAMGELIELKKFYAGAILIKDISNRLPDEYKPNPRTISRHIDGLGFKELKKHTNQGSGYEITTELFLNIITPLLPSLSSLSSLIEENQSDDKVTEVKIEKIKSDANDANDASDADLDTQELKKYIEKNPKDNANFIDEHFSKFLINELKNSGDLIENPRGTYRFLS